MLEIYDILLSNKTTCRTKLPHLSTTKVRVSSKSCDMPQDQKATKAGLPSVLGHISLRLRELDPPPEKTGDASDDVDDDDEMIDFVIVRLRFHNLLNATSG